MSIRDVLKLSGLPVAYGTFRNMQKPPFIAYIGAGQDYVSADNTVYDKTDLYQVEYYFAKKDEAKELEIEALLLENGYRYNKSMDSYIESEELYVIYYTTWRI